MYQIVCDNYVLHDARIDELKVINARCNLEVNKTGSLTFYIAPNHPFYDKINKQLSTITLYQDDYVLFRGRVLNDEISFDNIKTIECEGELSYLLDSIQRGTEYDLSGTENVIEVFLKNIISIHNSQVDDWKKFEVGVVNINSPNNKLYIATNYNNTLSTIVDSLVNVYGGYIVLRHDGNTTYIDYVDELTNVCEQKIEFGKNLIDMTRYIKGEDVYTAMIPLGATLSSGDGEPVEQPYDKRLKISSLPNTVNGTIHKNHDYIYDASAVERWGWIWRVMKWDDVTVASDLLERATRELTHSIDASLSIEMSAVDLHLLDVSVDRIKVGDLIQCVSLPHNLNTILIVKSVDIDVDAPANTTFKLVSPSIRIMEDVSITSGNKDNEKSITQVKETLNEGYPTNADVDYKIGNVKEWVSDNFMPMGADGNVDLSDYAKIVDVNDAFDTLANALGGV